MSKQVTLGTAAMALVLGLSVAAALDRPRDGNAPRDVQAQPSQSAPGQSSRPTATQPRAQPAPRQQQRSQSNGKNPSAAPHQSSGQAERTQDQQRAQTPRERDADRTRENAQDKRRAPARFEQNEKQGKSAQDAPRRGDRKQRNANDRDDRGQRNANDRDNRNKRNAGDRNDRDQRNANDRSAPRRQQSSEPRRQDRGDRTTARDSDSVRVNLNAGQRTRISTTIARLKIRPVSNVNFAISVGAVVPASVALHPLPESVVAIVPQYRDYRFVVVRDEIVIIHPRTHKIVSVMPYSGSERTVTASEHRPISLSDDQRQTIRRTIITRETTAVAPTTEIVVGEPLPETVVVREFPEAVYQTAPAVRPYRYIVRGQNIYLIDPASRRVIETIE